MFAPRGVTHLAGIPASLGLLPQPYIGLGGQAGAVREQTAVKERQQLATSAWT